MKVGFLHLGTSEHGINRYGRLLATEARLRGYNVLEVQVVLTDNQAYNRELFINAAKQFLSVDLVHIQFSIFNDYLWGRQWEQLENLQAFLNNCSCLIVATMHDVYYELGGLKGFLHHILPKLLFFMGIKLNSFDYSTLEAVQIVSVWKKIICSIKGWWINTFGFAIAALKELTNHAHLILVCSQEEARRLVDLVDPNKVKIIPHFVESRSFSINSVDARRTLNLVGKRVITVLGFIFPYKGHKLIVDAITYLPPDVQVIFAGNADVDKEFVFTLLQQANEKGVEHRIRYTGYLSEQELELYLINTDIAICAFKEFSASGSISTWISVACPILAFDLPQIREYNEIEPDAIQIFKPYSAEVLATAIQELLERDREIQSTKVARLGEKLSLSRILDKHLACYDSVIQHSSQSSIC